MAPRDRPPFHIHRFFLLVPICGEEVLRVWSVASSIFNPDIFDPAIALTEDDDLWEYQYWLRWAARHSARW